MYFIKKAVFFAISVTLSIVKTVKNKVSMFLDNVAVNRCGSSSVREMMISKYNDFKLFLHQMVGKNPITLRQLILSKYSDFKIFLHKSVYRRISIRNVKKSVNIQNDYLRFYVARVNEMTFSKDIKDDLAMANLKKMISIIHYFAMKKGIDTTFSYHIDRCTLDKVSDRGKIR